MSITALKHIKIYDFRNIKQAEVCLSPGINLISGQNGSGKTSLLEAIGLLGLGRSFRSRHTPRLIRSGAEKVTVFAETLASPGDPKHSFGLERHLSGEKHLKMDGEKVKVIADIAERLPLLLLNIDSFHILQAPPKTRRKLLDWTVFHVERAFFQAWRDYYSLLKQRNALLRQKTSFQALAPWDRQLIEVAEVIDHYRRETFQSWQASAKELAHQLLAVKDIEIDYHRGWPAGRSYADLLESSFPRDQAQSYTYYGPHRADINVKVSGVPAIDRLSTGQMKMLTTCLVLSQGVFLEKCRQKSCIYLIDDLPAELDSQHLHSVCQILSQLNAQILITAIEPTSVQDHLGNKIQQIQLIEGIVQ